MTEAVIRRIIPFSSVDGPGNRTAIFLQGCNLNCKYCHNPETIAVGEVPGSGIMTSYEVYREVLLNVPFIRGITVSGGECMLKPDFITELFDYVKSDGLGTMIDTNGTVFLGDYPALLKVTDGVMLDIKAFRNEDHINITGKSNETVLKNATFLAEIGKLYEVRVVVVPDLYDAKKSIIAIGELLSSYNRKQEIQIKIIAYRPNGVRTKYRNMKVPDRDYLKSLAEAVSEYGFNKTVII